jgi:polar amino acid transport system substrate-binding protein
MVAVAVHASLISPGTELGGWVAFSKKRESTDEAGEPFPIGYSNAGVVLACGDNVTGFKAGDRVACIGGNYALHTDYAVVPHHLCVVLPARVMFAQGAYAMLAATALHAVRRCAPELGEMVAVAGLGLVGHLCAQCLKLTGCYVIGWDVSQAQLARALRWGIDAATQVGTGAEVEATKEFTRGSGLDAGIIAFGGDASDTIQNLSKSMKHSPDGHIYGRIVVVGAANFSYRDLEPDTMANVDIRRAARTGPGYHDETWEYGAPYPDVFMRWTTRTNLELCMRWIAEGRLEVDALTTHTISLDRVDEESSAILESPAEALGVVIIP